MHCLCQLQMDHTKLQNYLMRVFLLYLQKQSLVVMVILILNILEDLSHKNFMKNAAKNISPK